MPIRRTRWPIRRKGSGIAMICTFGDLTDVTWWRELGLPVRAIVQADGTLRAGSRGANRAGTSVDPARRQRHYDATRRACRLQGPREDRR